MKKEQQIEHFLDTTALMLDTIVRKGQDYANADVLSNFKTSSAIIGTTPELCCLNMIAIKVARLGVLLRSQNSPNNESIRDSVLDLANYSILLDMILYENEG